MNIHDIAKKAGVSYMTVSRVINGSPQVREGTRKRVEGVIQKNNYVPLHAATHLSRKRSVTVGFILPKLEYAFYEPFINAFHGACSARGLSPELYFSQLDPVAEADCVRQLASRRALGIILSGSRVDNTVLLRSLAHVGNLVFLGIPPQTKRLPARYHFVGFADDEVAAAALGALTKRGHRRFLYVSSRTQMVKRSGVESGRRLGWERHLTGHGAVIAETLELDNDDYEEVPDPAWLAQALRRHGITAAFCENDFAALKLYRAAALAGLEIPRDLSVVGVDDLFVSRYLNPPLSTVALPYEALLGDILAHFTGGAKRPLRLRAPVSVRERGSIGDPSPVRRSVKE